MFKFDSMQELFRRRPNGPPPLNLLPSELALNDAQEGWQIAAQRMANTPHFQTDNPGQGLANPVGGVRGGKKGFDPQAAFSGVLQGLQDISKPTMVAPPTPFELDGTNPYLRGMQFGGEVGDGETVVVGENGPELVKKKRDGSVFVTPNSILTDPTAQRNAFWQRNDQTATPNQTPIMAPDHTPDNTQMFGTDGAGQTQDTSQGIPLSDITQGQNPAAVLGQQSDPTLDALKQQYQALLQAQQIKPSKWKDVGAALVQGFSNWATGQNRPVQSWHDIQVAQKSAPILRNIQVLEAERKAEEDARKAAVDEALKTSQTHWYDTKPSIAQAAQEDRTKRTNILGANVQRKLDDDFIRNNPVYDPANPTPAQVAQLERINRTPEDFDAYDHSKAPPIKRFGDTVVQYDPATKTWTDTGIDPHKNDPLESITLQSPSGGTETLKVRSSKKADILAGFQREGMRELSAKEIAGLRIQGSKDIAASNQNAAAGRANTHTAAQASQVLAAIRANAPKGSTEQDIRNKQQVYWNSLPEDVRTKITPPIQAP